MADSLTALITKIQKSLIDDGTRFSTDTCTAAIREALKDFNIYAPVFASELQPVVTTDLEYEVNDIDSRVLSVIGVWKWSSSDDNHTPLMYDAYSEDERVFYKLRSLQSSGYLLVRYTIPQTISGLDSATESTLSALYDQVLVGGAKAWAMQIRADSRIETINLQASVSDNYREQLMTLRNNYIMQLITIAKNRYPAVGKPVDAAWNDEWHGRTV